MVDFLTTAWMTADSPNPRISAQVICQVIDPVMDSACTIACTSLIPIDLPRAPSAHVTAGSRSTQHRGRRSHRDEN